MIALTPSLAKVIKPFACLFTKPTWAKLQVLLIGAILSPKKRTVTSALSVMGRADHNDYAKYHQVLNRAVWSMFKASRILLSLLLKSFDQGGALVFGIDETLERRWGKKINAKGIYRDAVRSSHSHFVKCSGLRWISLMWLAPIPWAKRVWALPVLTALAPSERYCREQGIRHKKLTDWARQLIALLRRWLPERDIVVVASSYSALDLLHACQALREPITMITRLRLDAALYKPAPPRKAGQIGRPRRKGERLPTLAARLVDPKTCWQRLKINWYNDQVRTIEIASDTALWFHYGKAAVPIRWLLIRDPKGEFEPQALLATNINVEPLQILKWFILRWNMEVSFQEARTHLGVESQRQWSDLAIARTTPLLFALFSLVTLAAHEHFQNHGLTTKTTSWYTKTLPTFSDALAALRERLWRSSRLFNRSSSSHEIIKLPKPLYERLLDTLCYAA